MGMVAWQSDDAVAEFRREIEDFLRTKIAKVTPRGDAIGNGGNDGTTPGAASVLGHPTAMVSDVRILPILRDEAQERWRTIAEAAAEVRETEFEDWPLENARSSRVLLRDLRRSGKTYLSSHERWASKSGIKATDRAIHEHHCLSKLLELAVSYDQLDVTNLACLEVAAKRRMMLETAYKGRPDNPNFAGSSHFMGYGEEGDGTHVDPAANRYRSDKLKEETNMLREARLTREESALAKRPGDAR
jgi:hypothetical protein